MSRPPHDLITAALAAYDLEKSVERDAVSAVAGILDGRRDATVRPAMSADLLAAIHGAYRDDTPATIDGYAEELRLDLKEILARHGAKTREEAKALYARLHIDDDDPLALSVDLFSPLTWSHLEVKNTKMLAHLLDPGQTHGLGDSILETFVRYVYGEAKARGPERANLSKAVVRAEDATVPIRSLGSGTERPRLDVTVSDQRSWSIIIEAKVGHDLRDLQLEDYERVAKEESLRFPAPIFVYLVPWSRHDELERSNWQLLTWLEIAAIVAESVRGMSGPGVWLARLWCSSVLSGIEEIPPWSSLKSHDSRAWARAFHYLQTREQVQAHAR